VFFSGDISFIEALYCGVLVGVISYKESIELFRENYEELNVEVVEEWGRFLEKINGKLDFK